jgi:hypothetical protein
MIRRTLLHRRAAETFDLRFWNQPFTVTVVFYADGARRGCKTGNDIQSIARDSRPSPGSRCPPSWRAIPNGFRRHSYPKPFEEKAPGAATRWPGGAACGSGEEEDDHMSRRRAIVFDLAPDMLFRLTGGTTVTLAALEQMVRLAPATVYTGYAPWDPESPIATRVRANMSSDGLALYDVKTRVSHRWVHKASPDNSELRELRLLADDPLRQALVEPSIRNIAAGSIAAAVHHRRGAQ